MEVGDDAVFCKKGGTRRPCKVVKVNEDGTVDLESRDGVHAVNVHVVEKGKRTSRAYWAEAPADG
jgi:hypothetical protein